MGGCNKECCKNLDNRKYLLNCILVVIQERAVRKLPKLLLKRIESGGMELICRLLYEPCDITHKEQKGSTEIQCVSCDQFYFKPILADQMRHAIPLVRRFLLFLEMQNI